MMTDEPFVNPFLLFVVSIKWVWKNDGSIIIPCYHVDGSTLAPPRSLLRRGHDEDGRTMRWCTARGGYRLLDKAWMWNKAT